MSIGETNKKIMLNVGPEVSIYRHNHEMSNQRLYQPDLKHIYFPKACALGEIFTRFQAELAQFLHHSHLAGCSQAMTYGLFPIIKGEPASTDDLTMRYDYSHVVQFQDKLPNYNKFFDMQEKRVEITKRRASAKNVQSKFKNIYGLLIGRVIKTCKEYFRAKQEHGNEENLIKFEDGRFKYIHDRLSYESGLESFQAYLNSYYNRDPELKRKRGKFIVQEYLMQDTINGLILADLIIMFLDESNADFQNYTNNDTKPKGQILKVLLNHQDREKLRDKFEEMRATIKEQDWKSIKTNKKEEMR